MRLKSTDKSAMRGMRYAATVGRGGERDGGCAMDGRGARRRLGGGRIGVTNRVEKKRRGREETRDARR